MNPKAYVALMLWEATHMRWQQLRAVDAKASCSQNLHAIDARDALHFQTIAMDRARDAYVRSARAGDVARKNAPAGTTKVLHLLDSPHAAHTV